MEREMNYRKMVKKKSTFIILLAALCLMAAARSMTALGAFPSVTENKSLFGYPWQKKAISVYEDSSLSGASRKVSWQKCKVIKMSGNAAYIIYKEGEQELKGWIELKRLVYNTEHTQNVAYANSPLVLYRRPGSTVKHVTIPQYSGGIVVSETEDWVQVIFCVNKQYYLGWIKKNTYTSYVRLSMDTTGQALADGVYTITARNNVKKRIEYKAASASFQISNKKNTKAQKFRLQHVSGSYYMISPASDEKMYLNANKKVSTNKQKWLLQRKGGYFYLRAGNTGKALSYSTNGIKIKVFAKKLSQQWRLTKEAVTPTKEKSVVFSQFDPKWGGSTYKNGYLGRRTISTSGCGLLALTNAVYALNGEFIPPTKLASYAAANGHYVYYEGTEDTLYAAAAKRFGKTYHFKHNGKVFSLNKVKKHLLKGGTAVALVPGHYVAIVAYRASDKKYLVLDSAVYGKRPTTIEGDWLSASALRSGYMKCEYFHLFSRK